MDLESLLLSTGDVPSPVDQILTTAAETNRWEVAGACSDCDAAALCPFRQNAEWIRNRDQLSALHTILRRGELATGQRWNFRDTFSLAASLFVGEWADFEEKDHPCSWTHEKVQELPDSPDEDSANTVAPLHLLLKHLYPHALFLAEPTQAVAELFTAELPEFDAQPLSDALLRELSSHVTTFSAIRELVARDYSLLDPAIYTPLEITHPLYQAEMEYSQSVAQGNEQLPLAVVSSIESRYLALVERELEWDLLQRNAAEALEVVQLLRRHASTIAKRSQGTRNGAHAEEDGLRDYEESLRSLPRLNQLKSDLQQLLGRNGFQFNAVESFGQPRSEHGWIVTLMTGPVSLRAIPAPQPIPATPAHDLPCFAIGSGNTEYRMPITFTFFRAFDYAVRVALIAACRQISAFN